MGERISQLSRRLKHDLGADKKKAGLLGGLFLVLIITLCRAMIGGETTENASADAIAVVPVEPAPPTAAAPQVVQPQTVAPAQPAGVSAPPPANALTPTKESQDAIVGGLARTLARDPFRSTSWIARMRRASASEDDTASASVPNWLDRLTQKWSEYQSRIDAAEALVEEKLTALTLQSTMIGPVSSAYISGRLVHEGDVIEGFSVLRIEPRRVTLFCSGVTRTLTVP